MKGMSVSRRELARRHGVSDSTVRRHIESGGPLADALLADGSLDSRKASEALRRVLSVGKVVPKDLADARTRRLRAQVLKLGDEVTTLRMISIQPAAAADLVSRELDLVCRHFRLVPGRARELAGRPVAEVQLALRGLVFDALEAISGDDGPEAEWWNDPSDPPEVDVDALSPNGLQARRIDLAAQKLEIERLRARGDLLDVPSEVENFEVKLGTIKSLVLALPARVADYVAAAGPDEACLMVENEVEDLLVMSDPPQVDDRVLG